jgi:hypothetical protein
MDCYWWINQTGIVLEVIGAIVIVAAAFKTKHEIKNIPDVWEPSLSEILRDVIARQAHTELAGFSLLGIGLIMQFIGGFA